MRGKIEVSVFQLLAQYPAPSPLSALSAAFAYVGEIQEPAQHVLTASLIASAAQRIRAHNR
jgi:hypothetical protein